MARSDTRHVKDVRQKNLVRLFNEACYRNNRWSVWADFVVMAAISISCLVDKVNAPDREKMYCSLAEKYNEHELECFAGMLAEIVQGIDENPDQDFLGELYMALELGNAKSGQFFTPYDVCVAMAQINSENVHDLVERNRWISVNDPACGAGALLVAFANECRRQGVNYQTSVLFVAQDVDLIVGCMCYIQLSLLGCPGYVVIANTLTNPATSLDQRGLIPVPNENIWYTPFYFRDVWHYRRIGAQLDLLMRKMPRPLEVVLPEAEAEPAPEQTSKRNHLELREAKDGQLTFF